MGEEPLVSAEGVSRHFRAGKVQAVRGVSIAFGAGEYVSITGRSGCGKSTLLHLLCGLEQPTEGCVLFQGAAPAGHARWTSVRAQHIGLVFQAFNLLPTFTARENVEVPMFGIERVREARERRAADLLERVGLADRTTHLPRELSGGEQQRLAVARCLANRPALILADEPTGNLDSPTAEAVMALLEACREEYGATLILVSHDPAIAARAPRRLLMHDGVVSQSAGAT